MLIVKLFLKKTVEFSLERVKSSMENLLAKYLPEDVVDVQLSEDSISRSGSNSTSSSPRRRFQNLKSFSDSGKFF
jgi:hypothetical protein